LASVSSRPALSAAKRRAIAAIYAHYVRGSVATFETDPPTAQDWLGNSHLAIVSVGGLVVWQQLGFGVVVFTAALLALPTL